MGLKNKRYTGMEYIIDSGILSSSIALANNSKVVNTITLSLNYDDLTIAKIYRSVWLTSRIFANSVPWGSGVDMSVYKINSEQGAAYRFNAAFNALEQIESNEDQSQYFLLNQSGSTKTFIFDGIIRYIINRGSLGIPGGDEA